jgi:hypothetical protein
VEDQSRPLIWRGKRAALKEYDRNGSLAVGPRSVASLQGWFSIRRKGKRSQWRPQSRLFKMFPARTQETRTPRRTLVLYVEGFE